jgi:cytochrome c peroxidase
MLLRKLVLNSERVFFYEGEKMKKIVNTIFAGSLVLGFACGGALAVGHSSISLVGGALYSDMNLSKNKNQSCKTCHHPSAGFQDPENRIDPVNFPVSDGSEPTDFGGRNAPTASYSGFSPIFHHDGELYVGGMFWDGRATGWDLDDPIAEQALGPFLNPVEMGLTSKGEVVGIVQNADYADAFEKVFGPDAFADTDEAYNNIGRAIAAFERSEKITKFSSKFDKFWKEQGRDVSSFGVDPSTADYTFNPDGFKSKAFTAQEAEGLALFNAADKGNCAACHLTSNHIVEPSGLLPQPAGEYPPLFTDFTYDNLGIPVNARVAELAGAQATDYGLGARTAELMVLTPSVPVTAVPSGTPDGGLVLVAEEEMGKFKVSTLRNVGRSAPYGHNGFFATLAEMTHFYNTRDVASEDWDLPEVPETVNSDELGNLGLTLDEEAAIVAFMNTLTD